MNGLYHLQPEQFLKFTYDCSEQKELDKNVETFVDTETFNPTGDACYVVYYLAYKKMLIASARDFVYIKHCRKINQNTWCDVSKSISHEAHPETSDKIRAEIILGGYLITEEADQFNGKVTSKVKLYSENNFKVNVPMFMAKNFASSEIKKFIEKDNTKA